jgi:hypothetical protein
LLLIASALAAATLGEDPGRRLLRVYPTEDVREDRSASIEYELTIDPEGKLEKCTVLRAVGDERLAGKTCAIIKAARFRYTRATTPDGAPAYGVIHTTSKFFLPDTTLGRAIRDHDFGPELEVYLQTLPNGVDDPTSVKVVTVIGPDGKVVSCEAAPDARADFAEVACDQVQTQGWGEVVNPAGAVVPYVRAFEIRFTTQRQSSES